MMSSELSASEMASRLQKLESENRRLKRAVEELSVLNDLSREIGASLDSDEIMGVIIRRSLEAVRAEQGVITLVDEDLKQPLKTLVRTRSKSADHSAFHLDQAILGWMLLNRTPIVINAPGDDDRFSGVKWHEEIRSTVSAPLLIRSRLIGAVTLYNSRSPQGFSEDDRRLLAIIGAQSAQIVENARLYEEERALIRVREELRLAAEIQQKLLPDEAPDVAGYDFAGRSIPAHSVGGDYFDYVVLAPRRIAACVADVSGKGLPAALMMANVQAAFRAQAGAHTSAAACLMALNRLLYQSMRRGSFVTIVYGMLDADAHLVDLANAGHNRPIVWRAGGHVERIDTAGMLAGAVEEITLPGVSVPLGLGDVLVLYSDGVTEAVNREREEFGEDRLISALHDSHDLPSAQIVEKVIDSVSAHVGTADPHDDITVAVIKRFE